MKTLLFAAISILATACAGQPGAGPVSGEGGHRDVGRQTGALAEDRDTPPVPPASARLADLGIEDASPSTFEYRPKGFLPDGVGIGRVKGVSSTDKAGLKPADVIVSVDGQPAWPGGMRFSDVVGNLDRLLQKRGKVRLEIHRYHLRIENTAEGRLVYDSPIREELTVTMDLP